MNEMTGNNASDVEENVPKQLAMKEESAGTASADETEPDNNNSSSKSQRIGWILVGLLAIAVAAAISALLISKANNEDSASSSSSMTDVTPGQPGSLPARQTPAPTQSPTITFESILQAILEPYQPLNPEIMRWLIEDDAWQGPFGTSNTANYNYQWLERYALALFWYQTKGDSWKIDNDWMSGKSVCAWFSAVNNTCPGPVTNLVLPDNGLKGSLPTIIFELTKLTNLHLAGNSLTGTIPRTVEQVQDLIVMDFDNNELSGRIPRQFRKLTNLKYLYLSNNQFTSTLPIMIGDMTSLQSLILYNNEFEGKIPNSIQRLTNLKVLSLMINKFTSTIPANIGELTSLTSLSLNTNRLSGTIPESIGNLSNLQYLALHRNSNLSGVVPPLPNNPNLNCYLGDCFTDVSNARTVGCFINVGC